MRQDLRTHTIPSFALCLILGVGLGACETSGVPKVFLEGNAIEEVAVGNTAAYENGHVYYAPGGRKTATNRRGEVLQRQWWVNEDGQWCETLVADESELCGIRWEKAGDVDYFSVGRGYRIAFKIEKGNPQGF